MPETIPGSLEIHDPSEVYQFRLQADQSFYAQGTIREIVKEAFRLGYERAKEDYQVDDLIALLSSFRAAHAALRAAEDEAARLGENADVGKVNAAKQAFHEALGRLL